MEPNSILRPGEDESFTKDGNRTTIDLSASDLRRILGPSNSSAPNPFANNSKFIKRNWHKEKACRGGMIGNTKIPKSDVRKDRLGRRLCKQLPQAILSPIF
ncbi:hypothetical protein SprV_0301064600 [Sparganum proliferum]